MPSSRETMQILFTQQTAIRVYYSFYNETKIRREGRGDRIRMRGPYDGKWHSPKRFSRKQNTDPESFKLN